MFTEEFYDHGAAPLEHIPIKHFYPGDILIKIDCRARRPNVFNTKHHAMLVISTDRTGYPVVAHMKFIDFSLKTGILVIEPCPAAKDLILIQCPAFSSELRAQIAWIARQAHQCNQLKISSLFLENENQKAERYRWADLYDAKNKIDVLRRQPIHATNVLANTEQMISCHDFVLSTIHMACSEFKEPIPEGLHIPPATCLVRHIKYNCPR